MKMKEEEEGEARRRGGGEREEGEITLTAVITFDSKTSLSTLILTPTVFGFPSATNTKSER
jgi:hypothetical protein